MTVDDPVCSAETFRCRRLSTSAVGRLHRGFCSGEIIGFSVWGGRDATSKGMVESSRMS